jgi:hypothetical protein
MAQCPKCGSELSLGAQYCGQCGVAIGIPQSTEGAPRPTSVSAIFTASAYIIQTKISESYKSRASRTDLGTFYQLSTFEIRETSGALVAIARHMSEDESPESMTSLENLTSLVSSLRAYTMETPEGVRIGELRGSGALIPNRPYLEIKDANGKEVAIIMMRVAKKPGAGFFSIGVTTWALETPGGEELARINWGKANRDWTVETPDGATIAEVQRLEVQDPAYQTSHEVKILNPTIDPYLVLATFFANPPGTK